MTKQKVCFCSKLSYPRTDPVVQTLGLCTLVGWGLCYSPWWGVDGGGRLGHPEWSRNMQELSHLGTNYCILLIRGGPRARVHRTNLYICVANCRLPLLFIFQHLKTDSKQRVKKTIFGTLNNEKKKLKCQESSWSLDLGSKMFLGMATFSALDRSRDKHFADKSRSFLPIAIKRQFHYYFVLMCW